MAERRTRTSNEEMGPGPKPQGRGIARRALLAGIGAGGVSAAAIAAAGPASGPTDDRPAASTDQPVYRETDHIREFYARSRF